MSEEIISPWPLTVDCDGTPVEVTGISGNSYVVENRIGLESPTTANEANVEAELPDLWAAHKILNP